MSSVKSGGTDFSTNSSKDKHPCPKRAVSDGCGWVGLVMVHENVVDVIADGILVIFFRRFLCCPQQVLGKLRQQICLEVMIGRYQLVEVRFEMVNLQGMSGCSELHWGSQTCQAVCWCAEKFRGLFNEKPNISHIQMLEMFWRTKCE